MSIYILIHGSWHGGWCWEKVVPLLEKGGHTVETPDLPGHGEDKKPASKISLKSYTDCVCGVLDAQSEPVILVGHSMGGVVITQAAEYRPDKIKTLVYLCAFLPGNGQSMSQWAQRDPGTLVSPNKILSEDKSSATVKEGVIQDAFYADCAYEDIEKAKSLLVPEPTAPLATRVKTTEENFGRIPRVYIECLRDKAISPSIQKQMHKVLPCERVISMDTHHSPFYSAPEILVDHLTSL